MVLIGTSQRLYKLIHEQLMSLFVALPLPLDSSTVVINMQVRKIQRDEKEDKN